MRGLALFVAPVAAPAGDGALAVIRRCENPVAPLTKSGGGNRNERERQFISPAESA